jgi:hypothetical protein
MYEYVVTITMGNGGRESRAERNNTRGLSWISCSGTTNMETPIFTALPQVKL